MGADTTAIKKYDERNPMNMTTTIGKHRLGKADIGFTGLVKCSFEPTGILPIERA